MSHPEPISLWPDPGALGTVTDLYQLTMMAGYAATGMAGRPAVFELFVRRLPPGRGYLVFAGLEQAIGDLLSLRFSREQVEYLRGHPSFRHVDPSWFDALEGFRFEGDVWSVPEGTIVFANEPLLRVEAPLAQTQWVETFLLASLSYPTLAATKAARVMEAAGERAVFDFGMRRGHGPHAGFLCARSSYLAGFAGTSNVEAARLLGIPSLGTMAHSWIQSFEDEPGAFAAFSRAFPESSTLLVDTYDTLAGVEHAAAIEPPIQAIRIDSGDIVALSRAARGILDRRGRASTRIIASGDLNETKIAAILGEGAPIDGFGVGTELITGGDAPALSMVYKLVAIDGRGRVKKAPGKRTYPLGKQVVRQLRADGAFDHDLVIASDEPNPGRGEPLLAPVVRGGAAVAPWPDLGEIRSRFFDQRGRLPEAYRGLACDAVFPIRYSDRLEEEARRQGLLPPG